jgi:hypothetical protein
MQSVETSKENADRSDADGTKPVPYSKAYGAGMVALALFNFLGFAGILIAYFTFVRLADTALLEATEVCKEGYDFFDIMLFVLLPGLNMSSSCFSTSSIY